MFACMTGPSYSFFRNSGAPVFRSSDQEAASRPGYERMGTTLVSAVAGDDSAVVTNIGDSRAYRWRGGCLRQLSRDDTLIRQLLAVVVLHLMHAVGKCLSAEKLGQGVRLEVVSLPNDENAGHQEHKRKKNAEDRFPFAASLQPRTPFRKPNDPF